MPPFIRRARSADAITAKTQPLTLWGEPDSEGVYHNKHDEDCDAKGRRWHCQSNPRNRNCSHGDRDKGDTND
jgi:hypothetical protein